MGFYPDFLCFFSFPAAGRSGAAAGAASTDTGEKNGEKIGISEFLGAGIWGFFWRILRRNFGIFRGQNFEIFGRFFVKILGFLGRNDGIFSGILG